MQRERVDRVFLLDADVVTFADYSTDVAPGLPAGCVAGLMTLEDQDEHVMATSLHFSYWTRDALSDFTSFCATAYSTPAIRRRLAAKYRRHVERAEPGGICEMTLLHLWRAEHQHRTCNLAQVVNGATADLSVSTAANARAGEYAMRAGFKRLQFSGGRPSGFNEHLRQPVRFLNVHCQGDAKTLMPFLATPHARRFFPQLNRLRTVAAVRARAARKLAGAAQRLWRGQAAASPASLTGDGAGSGPDTLQ